MSGNNVKVKKQTIDPSLTLEDVKKQLIEKGKRNWTGRFIKRSRRN